KELDAIFESGDPSQLANYIKQQLEGLADSSKGDLKEYSAALERWMEIYASLTYISSLDGLKIDHHLAQLEKQAAAKRRQALENNLASKGLLKLGKFLNKGSNKRRILMGLGVAAGSAAAAV